MPSRIVFAAHQTNFAARNRFTERHAAYYAARARGGAGMIVLEPSVVHPSDWPYEYAVFGYRPEVVHGYRLVAEAVRSHGTLLLAQLNHSGGQGTSHYSQRELWAPSPLPEVNSREAPKEMEREDIAAVVDGFALAAGYAMEGGLDGVEINAGQESLLRQFLSPLSNRRQDDYGGPLENRVRFAREVIEAVRRAVGEGAIVGLRLCADEYAPWAGIKPEDAGEIARHLTASGEVDYVSVTSGGPYSLHMTRAGLYAPPGYAAHLAAPVKEAVAVPVFAQGSIVDPEMAEGLLAGGRADAVEMTRALIADPDLPRKLQDERVRDIRPCVLCNQDCTVRSVQNPRLSCALNPSAGYETEAEFASFAPASTSRRVAVIGGGPAGLEAARVAALRGHAVTLYDRSPCLGGAVRLAAAAPGRERLALVVDWLEGQVRMLDVEVEIAVEVSASDIMRSPPDAVIVATGGLTRTYPHLELAPGSRVVSARDVLGGKLESEPGRAVILDETGNAVAMGVAEWLAARAWKVEVVTADMYSGQQLAKTLELTPWNQRAAAGGIEFRTMLEVQRVDGRTAYALDRFSREDVLIEDVDLVVCVNHEEPDERLYLELKQAGHDVIRAGDCVAPRGLGQAILEGHRAGRAV